MHADANEMLQCRLMNEHRIIAGAAAPSGSGRTVSVVRRDLVWVLLAAVALAVSSLFPLLDVSGGRVQTGEAPLRSFVVGLPIVACITAAAAAVRRSVVLAAIATGVLAPGMAFAGSLSIELFLGDTAAFADVGVAVSLATAVLGVVMLLRWFVYHPLSWSPDEQRPFRPTSTALAAVGGALGLWVVVAGLRDGFGLSWVATSMFMLLVPATLVVGGLTRTLPALAVAAASATAQLASVILVTSQESTFSFEESTFSFDESTISLDSALVLRTGVVGLCGLVAAVVLAVVSMARSVPDEPVAASDGEESWRWSADD